MIFSGFQIGSKLRTACWPEFIITFFISSVRRCSGQPTAAIIEVHSRLYDVDPEHVLCSMPHNPYSLANTVLQTCGNSYLRVASLAEKDGMW